MKPHRKGIKPQNRHQNDWSKIQKPNKIPTNDASWSNVLAVYRTLAFLSSLPEMWNFFGHVHTTAMSDSLRFVQHAVEERTVQIQATPVVPTRTKSVKWLQIRYEFKLGQFLYWANSQKHKFVRFWEIYTPPNNVQPIREWIWVIISVDVVSHCVWSELDLWFSSAIISFPTLVHWREMSCVLQEGGRGICSNVNWHKLNAEQFWKAVVRVQGHRKEIVLKIGPLQENVVQLGNG